MEFPQAQKKKEEIPKCIIITVIRGDWKTHSLHSASQVEGLEKPNT